MVNKARLLTMQTLHSERTRLDLMTPEDWPHFLYLQTHPKLMTFIRPILPESTIREMFELRTAPITWIEQRWYAFVIREANSDMFLGSIAFKIVDTDNARAEIGYLSHENAQGKGYMTEAATCLLHFLFAELNLKKVIAQCATENIGSWKVMEKIGMQREGELKANQYLNGKWYDSYYYGLVN